MEEIAWETQAHFRYDMECNIQSVSRTLGCNFKSEFTTPKQKKKKTKKKSSYQYMSANSYRDTDQHHHVINTNTTDAIKKKNPSLPTLVG